MVLVRFAEPEDAHWNSAPVLYQPAEVLHEEAEYMEMLVGNGP